MVANKRKKDWICILRIGSFIFIFDITSESDPKWTVLRVDGCAKVDGLEPNWTVIRVKVSGPGR